MAVSPLQARAFTLFLFLSCAEIAHAQLRSLAALKLIAATTSRHHRDGVSCTPSEGTNKGYWGRSYSELQLSNINDLPVASIVGYGRGWKEVTRATPSTVRKSTMASGSTMREAWSARELRAGMMVRAATRSAARQEG